MTDIPPPAPPSTAKADRFFLDQDQSSHWYIVPLSRKSEWDEWCELGGSPTLVTFENPTIGN